MITIEYTINDELMNADDGYDAAVFLLWEGLWLNGG